jgi:hypothetical protein
VFDPTRKEKKTMRRRIALLAAATAAVALGTGSAAADGPQIITQTLPFAGPYGLACDGVPIIANGAVTRRLENFYDGGSLVLQRRHVEFEGRLSLATTGLSVPYSGHSTVTTDFVARTATIDGQQAKVVLPGQGSLFQNSGRVVLDLSHGFPPLVVDESGPHDNYDPSGAAALCAALGG